MQSLSFLPVLKKQQGRLIQKSLEFDEVKKQEKLS